MPYTKNTWQDGHAGTGAGALGGVANQGRLNHMETGIQDGYSSFLDVESGKFGTAGTWAAVEAACTEAQNSGGPSAVVYMGGKHYEADSTIEFTRPFTLLGGFGIRGTRITHASGFTGFVFSGKEMKRDGEWEGSSGSEPTPIYDEADDDGGMTISGFSIVEDNRNTAGVNGIEFWDVDDLYMSNLQFGYLTGTALKLGADDDEVGTVSGMAAGRVRESDFERIRIYRCGDGSPDGTPDVPAFILQNGDHATSDGTNQNFFSHFRFVYNEGRMLLRGGAGSSNSLRRTIFRDMQLHGLADNNNWVPEQWFPFDLVTLEGAVRETLFDGVTVNGNRAGTACWAMKAHPTDTGSGAQPKRLILRNINAVNVHGDLVRVEEGDSVYLDGWGLGGVEQAIMRVNANAGPDASPFKGSVNEMGYSAPAAGDFVVDNGSVRYSYHNELLGTAT